MICRLLQQDRATQNLVVDLGSPGPASGFLALEMDEQSIDGANEGEILTSYSIVMYILQSSSDDRWRVGRMELQEICELDMHISTRRAHIGNDCLQYIVFLNPVWPRAVQKRKNRNTRTAH